MEKMPGETDAGLFQRLATQERAAARVWRELGETELGLACDRLAVVYPAVVRDVPTSRAKLTPAIPW